MTKKVTSKFESQRTGLGPVAVSSSVMLTVNVAGVPTVVCEASSFQLEDTLEFAPEAAVLLNVDPDTLVLTPEIEKATHTPEEAATAR